MEVVLFKMHFLMTNRGCPHNESLQQHYAIFVSTLGMHHVPFFSNGGLCLAKHSMRNTWQQECDKMGRGG